MMKDTTDNTAFVIVGFTTKDADKLRQYGAAVPSTLKQYSGKILTRGPAEKLHGDFSYETQVVITFPSRKKALDWFHSADYQALVPVRNEAMDSQFQLIG